MLAFLVDQVQQLCCPLFQAAWHKMKTKCHLLEEIAIIFTQRPEIRLETRRFLEPKKGRS